MIRVFLLLIAGLFFLQGAIISQPISRQQGQKVVLADSTSEVGNVQKVTISGTITDANTGETLIGVSVRVLELEHTGTATNTFGFYSLSLDPGEYTLVYSYIGYQRHTRSVHLEEDKQINVALEEATSELDEITITAQREDENITRPQTGVNRINMEEVSQIPVFMGEQDILKTIQLLPGVQAAGEGDTGFLVRGGTTDQNLILLDGAPVYNASHLMGFFSTFNSSAIKDATLYKGSMPAEFGGRISSVLDIQMNEGNNQNYGGGGGIGLISSSLNVEGPIQRGQSSFLISGRRTYADLFLKLSNDEDISDNSLYFYDLNAKANLILSDKNRVYLSGYLGRDNLGIQDLFGIDWGNKAGTLRWNHLINNQLFSNTSLIYSDYSYNINVDFEGNQLGIKSQIQDWNLKQEFQYFPDPDNTFNFGINSIYHTITPGEVTVIEASGPTPRPLQDRYSWENAAYYSHEWSPSPHLDVTYGVRLSAFSILGGGEFYSLNNQHEVTDTTRYEAGDFVETHRTLEPRLSASYQLNDRSSVKTSYNRASQNMHLISNSTSTSPTDRWIPSSNIVEPQIADQVSLGYFRNFSSNLYEFSTEIYYKYLQNQIDYRDGADVTNSDLVEKELLFGEGRAYGAEFLLKKSRGRFSGWIGYTLARTEKLIPGINSGNWYPARQDRTHDITLVGMYDLNERWSLSATWLYQTGNAVTFPSGKYRVDNQVVYHYTERNGYRMPDYHRLDIGANWQLSDGDKYSSELSFSLYNAYGRENPYVIDFRESETNPAVTEAYQVALFRWVPAITYNFNF